MLIYLNNGQIHLLAEVRAMFPGLHLKQVGGPVQCYAAPLAGGQQGIAQVRFLRQQQIRYRDDELERANWIRTFFYRVELGNLPIESVDIHAGAELLSYEVTLKNRTSAAHLSFPTNWRGGEEITGTLRRWLVIQQLKDERLVALGVGEAGRVEETLYTATRLQEMETWLQERHFEQWICTTMQWSIFGVYRQQLPYMFL